MKIGIDKLKSGLDPKLLSGKISLFLEKKSKYIIFILMLALVGYGSFIWYRYVYNSEWNSSRVQEYMKTKDEGTAFNKNRFDEAVTEKEERSADYQSGITDIQDVFKLKQ